MNDMDNMTANSDVQRLDFNTPALQRKRRIRALKDHRALVRVHRRPAVLGAITLIFFYLAQVVLPMFRGAELEARKAQQPAWLADAGKPLLLAIEQNQSPCVWARRPARFFSLRDGALLTSKPLPLPEGSRIVSVGQTPRHPPAGARSGQWPGPGAGAQLQGHLPEQPEDHHPELAYPFGEAPLEPIRKAAPSSARRHQPERQDPAGRRRHRQRAACPAHRQQREPADRRGDLEQERLDLPQLAEPIRQLLIDPRHMWLYAISGKASADVLRPAPQAAQRSLQAGRRRSRSPASARCWAASR